MQSNQRMPAQVIHKREDLIPGELWTAGQELFKWNTLPFLHDDE
jgi:hypothetical protein